MFDWNDQELSNIIWGEAGESDDHIVPYPEASDSGFYDNPIKKEVNDEGADSKPTDQKKPTAKTNFHGYSVESNSQSGKNGLSRAGFGTASWDLSLSNDAKTHQDSMGTAVSNDLAGTAKYDSPRGADETTSLQNSSETRQNQHEDREQGDYIDYGWDNIGSFDDFDRIFSNDDPLFGHASLGDSDELWSSSKDVISTPEKSFPLSVNSLSLELGVLRSEPEQFKTKTEYALDSNQQFTPSYEKMNSQYLLQASVNQTALEMAGNSAAFNSHLDALGTPNELANKENRQKKSIKSRKKSDKKSEAGQFDSAMAKTRAWSLSSHQFQQFDSAMAKTSASPVLSQQRRLQGSDSPQYHHFSNPLLAPCGYGPYGTLKNYYPAVPALPHLPSGVDIQKSVFPGYEVSSGNANQLNKSPNIPLKPPTMTPQEKIEKLRRRQQMQAMLAIQKQQQQLNQQVSSTNNNSSVQNLSNENQMQMVEGGKVEFEENLSAVPSIDPTSPMEQDDSNTISAVDGCSVDITFYRLQDTIAKLDSGIRLCIRDSLFRLAQSAMQRNGAGDTSSAIKSRRDELQNEETNNHNRSATMPDVETETNPADRTVAHLLFYRPLDSLGHHLGTPESPVSTKPSYKSDINDLMNSTSRFEPDSSENMQYLSQYGPRVDSSENASNNRPTDGRAMEGEASL